MVAAASARDRSLRRPWLHHRECAADAWRCARRAHRAWTGGAAAADCAVSARRRRHADCTCTYLLLSAFLTRTVPDVATALRLHMRRASGPAPMLNKVSSSPSSARDSSSSPSSTSHAQVPHDARPHIKVTPVCSARLGCACEHQAQAKGATSRTRHVSHAQRARRARASARSRARAPPCTCGRRRPAPCPVFARHRRPPRPRSTWSPPLRPRGAR